MSMTDYERTEALQDLRDATDLLRMAMQKCADAIGRNVDQGTADRLQTISERLHRSHGRLAGLRAEIAVTRE